jgi:hypothetical protein
MFVAVLMEDVSFVSFVSGPAHILCLTVASGCNKERCTTEIEVTVALTVESSIFQTVVSAARV